MAYSHSTTARPLPTHYRDVPFSPAPVSQQRKHTSKLRFAADLSQCLIDFVIQLLPTPEELSVKEDVRKLLEKLIRTLEPDSRLLSFGSTANGFSLRNSDMDLCCLIDSTERLAATDLVTMLGDLLERETKFHVKPLPHARIPIVKLTLDPSPGLPLGIACDIGFENRLALENTRLLMCYAMVDPTRVRTIVLFLKVWSKRRKINSPYKGTLSSYGYVLLVIYFLVHVKNPPVLPNLQQMHPFRPITKEDTHLNGYNIWFFDDIDLLRQRWNSENAETVAELLIDFFRYYAREFPYNTGVASIRAGLLRKDNKGWQNDFSAGRFNDVRERNRFCIEDPFETDFNVARCVTRDGLYTIRGEFMRASRILASRPERAIVALAELCEERKDEDLVHAPPYGSHRASLPPQTPYTIGSHSMRPKGAPAAERFSPPTKFFDPGARSSIRVNRPAPPEHMAPKRSKWTSPPPAEAPPDDHNLFESQLGKSIELATSSTEAREKDKRGKSHSCSSNSEHLTDEERSEAAESDEVMSVRSFTEGTNPTSCPAVQGRPSWNTRHTFRTPQIPVPAITNRGRYPRYLDAVSLPFRTPPELHLSLSRLDSMKRSMSQRPARGPSWTLSTITPLPMSIPLPSSPDSPFNPSVADASAVYYQTPPRSPIAHTLYPSPGSQIARYQIQHSQNKPDIVVPPDIFPPDLPPSLVSNNTNNGLRSHSNPAADMGKNSGGPETPTPGTYSHSHTLSSTTITASSPPPPQVDNSEWQTQSPSPTVVSPQLAPPSLPVERELMQCSISSCPKSTDSAAKPEKHAHNNFTEEGSPQASSTSNSSSPSPSSTGYATSVSRSPSPQSPPLPATAIPPAPKNPESTNGHNISSRLPTTLTELGVEVVGGVRLELERG